MTVLSFVIPAYNSARFLDKCLASMVGEKTEIIVVNDGSTDNTAEIVTAWCRKYPNIRLINQENRGHGGALNTGCAAAGGKYLKVVDADDWVDRLNLPKLISLLENCGSDVVLCHHYTHNIATGEVKKWKSYPPAFGHVYTLGEILSNWKAFDRSLTFHGIIYNTAFYHRFGIRLSEGVFYEDHEYAAFPCCHAGSILPLDLFLYHYRIGDADQSISQDNQRKRMGHTEKVLGRFLSEYHTQDCGDHGRDYIVQKARGLLLSYLTTALLVARDKDRGARQLALFCRELPEAAVGVQTQYRILEALCFLRIPKTALDAVLGSKLYNKLRGNKEFL